MHCDAIRRNRSEGICYIYPPWAQYGFKWAELPELFPTPENYGRAMSSYLLSTKEAKERYLRGARDNGYTVSADDQEYFSGPEGGGLIVLKGDERRWFPRILINQECVTSPPPGFSRSCEYGIYILAPLVTAMHRLGEAVLPTAPSPLFSVEPIEPQKQACFLALAFVTEGFLERTCCVKAFASLGIQLEPVDETPNDAQMAFERIQQSRFHYKWYKVFHHGVQARLLVAAIIQLSLGVAVRADGSLRMAHLFCSDFLAGIEFPSATKWTQWTRRIRTASDW